MPIIPQRAALAGSAGAFRRRGIPGVAGADADQPEVDVLGAAGQALGALLPTPPAGGFTQAQYQGGAPVPPPGPTTPAPAGLSNVDPKSRTSLEIAAYAKHMASTGRTDPAGGTGQGASQVYRGTGEVRSRTGETGGVTTGAPGKASPGLRVSVPGRGMVDYNPDDPSVREAFGSRGGSFMRHSERTAPASRVTPAAAAAAVPRMGPPSAAGHGGSLWTESDVPEGAQIGNWDAFLKSREAEEQAFNTALAQGRAGEATAGAQTARAEELQQEPFMAENIAAAGKLSEAQVKAATDISNRDNMMKITSQAAAQINEMRANPKYATLPPEEQKRLEDQIWDQARLTLSALSKTNLYPRPDPYAFLGGAPAAAPEEKPSQ